MVVSARARALKFLLMAARALGPVPSFSRLLSSPARRRRSAPPLALLPRMPLRRRSQRSAGAPAPTASGIAGDSGRPARSRAWVLPLRSRYRGLGRSRGAMSGARRATVVIPGSLPAKSPSGAAAYLGTRPFNRSRTTQGMRVVQHDPSSRRQCALDELVREAERLQVTTNEFIGLATMAEVELPDAVYETNVTLLRLPDRLRELARGAAGQPLEGVSADDV